MFLCVFVESVKLTQHEFYKLYCDLYIFFNDLTFDDFNAIETLTNDAFPISQFQWWKGCCVFGILICWTHPMYQHDLFGVIKL